MRTVAHVEYALNRCAIADRFPLLQQRALLAVNGPSKRFSSYVQMLI
jgi:hypothetical protein